MKVNNLFFIDIWNYFKKLKILKPNAWLTNQIKLDRLQLSLLPDINNVGSKKKGFNSTINLITLWVVLSGLVFFLTLILVKNVPELEDYFRIYDQNYKKLLEVFIGAIATILGIGVPILILVVENISSRNANSLLRIFLEESGVVQTSVLGLSLLVILIILWFVSSFLSFYDLFYAFNLSFILTLAVIIIFLRIIVIFTNINKYFSDSYMEEKLSEEISSVIRKQLSIEVINRLSENRIIAIFKKVGFFHYLGWGNVRDFYPIYWPKSGFIEDYNLDLFNKSLENKQIKTIGDLPRGFYTRKGLGKVNKNEIAFYLRCEKADLTNLARKIFSSIKISTKRANKDNFPSLMEMMKNRTVNAIRKGNEMEYEISLNRYCQILQKSSALPLIQNKDEFPFFAFGNWNVTNTIITDLRTIAEESLQSPQERYIRWLSWSLSGVMSGSVLLGLQDHIGDIPAILDLFKTIYYLCYKAGKTEIATASYDPLLDTFLDPHRFWSIKHGNPSAEEFTRRKNVYWKTIEAIAYILKNSIDNNDVTNEKRICNKLNIGELKTDMFPNSQWAREEWQLRMLIDQANYLDHEQLTSELDLRKKINDLPDEIAKYIGLIKDAASAYIYEGVAMGKFHPTNAFDLIQPFLQSHKDLTNLTETFLYQNSYYAMSDWSMFNHNPETNRVFSPNFEQKFFYNYILKGIYIISHYGLNDPKENSISSTGIIERLEETSKLILRDWKNKWGSLLDIDLVHAEEMVKGLLHYFKNSMVKS